MYQTSNSVYGNYFALTQLSKIKDKISNSAQQSQSNQQRKPVGLVNIGNSCYINVIFQVLFHTKPFNDFMISLGEQQITKSSDFVKSFLIIWFKATQACIEPDPEDLQYFKTQLGLRYQAFNNLDQQDAVEFFLIFLEYCQKDLQSVVVSVHRVTRNRPLQQSSDQLVQSLKNSLDITQTFSGQLEYKMKCTKCNNITENIEDFINIAITLRQASLFTLMQEFFNPEQVKSQTACGKCNLVAPLLRSLVMKQLPQILVLQIKCYNGSSQYSSTLQVEQMLNIYTFTDRQKNQNECNYSLFAIVNHSGSVHSGHYTCIIKDQTRNIWHNFNDTRVSEYSNTFVTNELNASKQPYMLFYQKQ